MGGGRGSIYGGRGPRNQGQNPWMRRQQVQPVAGMETSPLSTGINIGGQPLGPYIQQQVQQRMQNLPEAGQNVIAQDQDRAPWLRDIMGIPGIAQDQDRAPWLRDIMGIPGNVLEGVRGTLPGNIFDIQQVPGMARPEGMARPDIAAILANARAGLDRPDVAALIAQQQARAREAIMGIPGNIPGTIGADTRAAVLNYLRGLGINR